MNGMSITRGASVWTSDGQQLGTVDGLIVGEGGAAIRAVVVRRNAQLDRDVEIPAGYRRTAAAGRRQVPLAADQRAALPGFAEANYTAPGADAALPAGYSADGLLVPSSGYVPIPTPAAPDSQMAAPADGDAEGGQ